MSRPFKASPEDAIKTINILLMGETGVGKSTFINSFANYVRCRTFDDAVKTKPLILIPTSVTVFDAATNTDRTLVIGSDNNEQQEVGASATQHLKTYLFPIEGASTLLQIIDTPGIGDTRGPEKDDENCQGILEFLAQLDDLHAICLLMKPSNERNTVFFSYCVRGILSQLHKSACDNVVFVFTNTKGSDYRPGSTFSIVKKMRDDIAAEPPYAKIPISDDNLFCVDNECFKNLLALDAGVRLLARTRASCRMSWEISCEEIMRFIKYVKKLEPHKVKDTVSVNQARDLILKLGKPMSEICQLLQENVTNLQIKEKECEKSDQGVEELKKKLYKPLLDLEVIKMERPATVCTNPECPKAAHAGNLIKYTKCCVACLSAYFTSNTRRCDKMRYYYLTCVNCNCSYKKHVFTYYDTKFVNKQVVDKNVKESLDSEEIQRQNLNTLIKEMKIQKKEFEEELAFIATCAAKNAYYLQNHALTSSYDHFKEYINLSLQRQKSLGEKADMDAITNLNRMLSNHEKLIESLKDTKGLFNDQTVNEATIQKDTEKLFQLKHAGPKLRQIFDARSACVKNNVKANLKNILTETVPSWFLGL